MHIFLVSYIILLNLTHYLFYTACSASVESKQSDIDRAIQTRSENISVDMCPSLRAEVHLSIGATTLNLPTYSPSHVWRPFWNCCSLTRLTREVKPVIFRDFWAWATLPKSSHGRCLTPKSFRDGTKSPIVIVLDAPLLAKPWMTLRDPTNKFNVWQIQSRELGSCKMLTLMGVLETVSTKKIIFVIILCFLACVRTMLCEVRRAGETSFWGLCGCCTNVHSCVVQVWHQCGSCTNVHQCGKIVRHKCGSCELFVPNRVAAMRGCQRQGSRHSSKFSYLSLIKYPMLQIYS